MLRIYNNFARINHSDVYVQLSEEDQTLAEDKPQPRTVQPQSNTPAQRPLSERSTTQTKLSTSVQTGDVTKID